MFLSLLKQIPIKIAECIKNNIKTILCAIGAGIAGIFIGNGGKKKAVAKAYKKGYEDCSKIYERKLKDLTEAFLKKEKNYLDNRKEYDKLLNEYEKYINKLESKNKRNEEENKELKFLIDKYSRLLKLK